MDHFTLLTPVSPCEYLPDRQSRLRGEIDPHAGRDEYMQRLRDGWRRFGPVMFRPECPDCRMCQSLRVPVASFHPSASQRRAWKKNAADVAIRVGQPSVSPDRLELFARFHEYGHHVKGWPDPGEQSLDVFLRNPWATEEWAYYLGERLLAVGYVDVLPAGLSAIYFYWDPDERQRSLGTFNILSMIASARQRGLPHVYLGYYVEGCRSLEYKARFTPSEMLIGGQWRG